MGNNISKTLLAGIERSIKLSKVLGVKVPLTLEYKELLEVVENTVKNKGVLMSIKLLKYWYNCLLRTAMQEPITEKPPFYCRLGPRNSPRILRNFERMVSRKDDVLRTRLILTAFRSYELITVAPVVDFTTIVADSQGPKNYRENVREDFNWFLSDSPFTRMIRKEFQRSLDKVRKDDKGIPFHYTTKQGISGSALGTAGLQSLYFESEESEMKELIIKLSKHFYKEDLGEIIDSNIELFSETETDLAKPKDLEKIKEYPGRISFISDKGGKTRVIAIGNYWIQNTLKPLHQVMFKVLRSIAMDGTYDQISQSSRVAKATTEGPVWSYDLTAATDRLPLIIQSDVMEFLDKEIGTLWSEILHNMTFFYKDKEFKYTVGQPMGLYSSWASLAITHHFIIQYLAYKRGMYTFLDYAVLGDDVAIWSEPIAEDYEHFISLLGVEISKAKSYIPKTSNGPWKAEFAKRQYLNGIEMSGISASVLKEGMNNLWNLPELVTFLTRHGLEEIVRAPISRFVEVFGYKPKDFQRISFAFRISEILGGPSIKRDLPLDTIIAESLDNLTPAKLMEERIERLTESVSDLCADLFDVEEEDREELENLLSSDEVGESTVISRVLKTRIDMILELEKRMLKYIPSDEDENLEEFFNRIKSSDEQEYEDNILTKVKDIEFIPSIRLSEIMKGITLHKDKKSYRVLFLKSLAYRLLRNNTNSGNKVELW
jgi:hypothetical protein